MLGAEVTLCGVDDDVAAPVVAEHVPFETKFHAMMERARNADPNTKKLKDRISDIDLQSLRDYHGAGGVITMDMVASMHQFQTADCVCSWVRQKIPGLNFPPFKQIKPKYDQYNYATSQKGLLRGYCSADTASWLELEWSKTHEIAKRQKKKIMPITVRNCTCSQCMAIKQQQPKQPKKEQQQATPLPPSPCEAPNAPTPGGSAALDFSSPKKSTAKGALPSVVSSPGGGVYVPVSVVEEVVAAAADEAAVAAAAAVKQAVQEERLRGADAHRGQQQRTKRQLELSNEERDKAVRAKRAAEAAAAQSEDHRDRMAGTLQQTEETLQKSQAEARELARLVRRLKVVQKELEGVVQEEVAARDRGAAGAELHRQLQQGGGGGVAADGRALSERALRRRGGEVLDIVFAKGQGSIDVTVQLLDYISRGSRLSRAARKVASGDSRDEVKEAQLAREVVDSIKGAVTSLRENSQDTTCRAAMRTILAACASGEEVTRRSSASKLPAKAALLGTSTKKLAAANRDRSEFNESGRIKCWSNVTYQKGVYKNLIAGDPIFRELWRHSEVSRAHVGNRKLRCGCISCGAAACRAPTGRTPVASTSTMSNQVTTQWAR
jgi:hypothetical protein